MEDRRRRRVAFENLAKEMLRFFDNSDDVKVGTTKLQERLEALVQISIPIQQVAQQARNEIGQKVFEIFCVIASWARWDAHWKGLVALERRCQDTSQNCLKEQGITEVPKAASQDWRLQHDGGGEAEIRVVSDVVEGLLRRFRV